jgi:hypothetical protein
MHHMQQTWSFGNKGALNDRAGGTASERQDNRRQQNGGRVAQHRAGGCHGQLLWARADRSRFTGQRCPGGVRFTVDQGQLSRYLRSSMEAKSPPRARKTERTSRNDTLLLLAFGLSGLAGLGYEILWTRLLGIGIGSEMLAVFGVLAGFFGGMALGAALLQPLTRRVKHPLFLFAVLEIIAAVYALASPSLLHGLALKFPLWLGPKASSLQTVLAAGAALLPATICLGATLAAIVEARRRRFADSGGYGLGRLYGANTFGALLGVMLTVYLFLPGLGFQAASMLLAGFGFAAAACAVIWGQK